MSWNRIGAAAALVLIAGAYLVGYLPEHSLRTAAESEATALRERLGTAEARVRLGRLLGDALTLKEAAMRQNYGQAQDLSSAFFDRVREEATASATGDFQSVLNGILSRRDSITASLTRGDPEVAEVLHSMELQLRRALGYGVPAAPPQ